MQSGSRHVVDVSLVLTVLNEADNIQRLLQSVEQQSVLPREVVVVDAGSSDGTRDALQSWAARSGVEVIVEVLPRATISEGRNRAIALARHDLIAITDAGVELRPDWLASLYGALAEGADVASGFFRASPRGRRLQRIIASTITPSVDEIDPDAFLPSSRSVALRREWWRRVGGYPEWLDYCEDLVFDLALKNGGANFVFVPGALAEWDARSNLRSYFRQYYRYARGDGKAGLWPKRHAVRYGAYAAGGLLAHRAIRDRSVVASVLLAAGGATYMAKFVRRVFRSAARMDLPLRSSVPLVPVVVATGDVAKMTGYLVGRMWRRRHASVAWE